MQAVSEIGILIHQKMEGLGFSRYLQEPYMMVVETINRKFSIGNDFLFLNNKLLEIPYTAKLTLESPHNLYITSKADYESQSLYKHQAFTEMLEIKCENYGIDFIPYKLEFIKVIPKV